MVHLNIRTYIIFCLAVTAGVASGIAGRCELMIIAFGMIILTLSFSPEFKEHRMFFLMPLSFLSGISFNIHLGIIYISVLFHSRLSALSLLVFLFIIFFLISVELLILGIIGQALWGEQKMIRYNRPFPMMSFEDRHSSSIRGFIPEAPAPVERYLHKF